MTTPLVIDIAHLHVTRTTKKSETQHIFTVIVHELNAKIGWISINSVYNLRICRAMTCVLWEGWVSCQIDIRFLTKYDNLISYMIDYS